MVRLKEKIRSVIRRKEKDYGEPYIEEDYGLPPGFEDDVGIEESEGEYVLLKIFERESPDIGFSYAANKIEELKKDISALKAEADSLSGVNATLRVDLERLLPLKGALDELRKDIEEKDDVIFAKNLDIKKVNKALDRMQVEVSELRRELKDRERLLERGNKRLKQMEDTTRLDELEAELSELRVTVTEQKDTLAIKSSQAEEFKQMAAAQDEELNTIKATWWQQGKELKKMKIELEEKTGILSSKEGLIEELTKKTTSLNEVLESMRQDVADREKRLSTFGDHISDAENQQKRLEKELREKEEVIGKITNNLGRAESRVDDLRSQLEERDLQLQGTTKRVRELEDTDRFEDLEAELSKLKVTVEGQKDTLSLKTSEVEDLKQAAAAQEDELSTIKATWWQQGKESKKMKIELEEKTSILSSKEALVEELKKKSASLSELLESMKRDVTNKEDRVEEYEDRIGRLHGKIGALRSAIGIEEGQRKSLSKRLFGGKKELTLEDELDLLTEDITVNQGRVVGYDKKVSDLEIQVERQKKALEEKEGTISAKTSEIEKLLDVSSSLKQELRELREKTPVEGTKEVDAKEAASLRLAKLKRTVEGGPEEIIEEKPVMGERERLEEAEKEAEKLKIKKELRMLEIEKKSTEKLLERLPTASFDETERSMREASYTEKLTNISRSIEELRERL
ncbi:MAG: hypothetical protein V3T58_02215 [Candidatus Hydrothermarchaeales archaeon]